MRYNCRSNDRPVRLRTRGETNEERIQVKTIKEEFEKLDKLFDSLRSKENPDNQFNVEELKALAEITYQNTLSERPELFEDKECKPTKNQG